jgi:hypothetical protein
MGVQCKLILNHFLRLLHIDTACMLSPDIFNGEIDANELNHAVLTLSVHIHTSWGGGGGTYAEKLNITYIFSPEDPHIRGVRMDAHKLTLHIQPC